jgi:hypothetical protein
MLTVRQYRSFTVYSAANDDRKWHYFSRYFSSLNFGFLLYIGCVGLREALLGEVDGAKEQIQTKTVLQRSDEEVV